MDLSIFNLSKTRLAVEVFSSDQGPELFNNKLKFFLEANGIEFTTTNAYSPEENGLVEKMNGVVMSRVRCLLTAANMPWSLGGEAFNFAIEVMNISGSSALGGETPYYRRFSERPDVSTLRTWGCVAFIFTPKVLRKSKLENPGKPGLFVGYAKHSESFRILNLLTGKTNEVRSVEFEEEWTVEASYVEKLLSNRYGKGRHELPTVIPPIFLTVYVDDVIIAANAENIKLVVGELERKFSIKDLRSVSLLLGMKIKYIPGQAMWISQRGLIEKILQRFQMEKCRAVATPQTLGPLPLPATLDDEDVNDPNVPYRAIVDCLQYLVQCTRPDLANTVRALGKYLNKHIHENYTMAKRVLRYLQGTSDFGLVWEKKESPDLHFVAYADADLGNGKDDRHSITGYVLQLNCCTYAYKSRKQRIVTDDTCCAEFVAASECSTMIVWTHNLCKELNLTRYHPTVLYQDNQATITVLTEIKGNYKTKSVDLKYHKVRDFQERGEFEVRYCPSSENLADIFTKALGPTLFRKFRQRMNVMALPTANDNGNADGSN
ncbi:unnamed protein product [Phytophthora fragariaefolia]|uniref:Unnamed protein product n=1 Tax=Phytophthora fragariaefolia TaxID=1490495 RepID=A0A9W6WV74_9STRA|nr:unnamed protein product [Phytophthora fragariaefolia]